MSRRDYGDFSAFAANRRDGSEENPVKNLYKLAVSKKGRKIRISLEANGFLYKMARSIVGALVDAGMGKLEPEEFDEILVSRKRTSLVVTAPARGLTLEKVFY